jgi:hypothetical protein
MENTQLVSLLMKDSESFLAIVVSTEKFESTPKKDFE